MKSIEEFNKQRILNMNKYHTKCRCPKCKKIVIPRRVYYKGLYPNYSGLLWCPKCLKGESAMFWYCIE